MFTLLWIGLGICALIIEGVALFNSRSGDTLSEHIWAWLGVRRGDAGKPGYGFVAPRWTLRVARLLLIFFLVWLTLHFVTGGWV